MNALQQKHPRKPLHQKPFTTEAFDTGSLWHRKPLTLKLYFDQTSFTPKAHTTRSLLHQRPLRELPPLAAFLLCCVLQLPSVVTFLVNHPQPSAYFLHCLQLSFCCVGWWSSTWGHLMYVCFFCCFGALSLRENRHIRTERGVEREMYIYIYLYIYIHKSFYVFFLM